jgi:abortive infection bacteriophage resistance protein
MATLLVFVKSVLCCVVSPVTSISYFEMYHITYMNVNGMKLSICVFTVLCNFVKYSSFYAAMNYKQE